MADPRFLETLQERVLLGDGAYGTEFLRRGCMPGRPLDELNLTRPELVAELHREYVSAGSQLTKTNTFLANRFRLESHGLGDRVREINQAGVRLAREAARGGLVAGVIGPLTECRWADRTATYQEQCAALAEAGCDLFLLETFMEASDLLAAVEVGRQTGLPLVCEMALTLERGFDRLALYGGKKGPSVLGTNCVDPEQALRSIERMARSCALPLAAFPSAGRPGEEKSPPEFAEAIVDLVKAGARLVGGCCGTGPAHIRAAAAALGERA
ncbi:MAG TPA: homocysteine S-methyltransferase family protein [Planctomycetota bacterium]|nr:homocysteine S-methyltransferase family protein [Planctomycetota bacterium]